MLPGAETRARKVHWLVHPECARTYGYCAMPVKVDFGMNRPEYPLKLTLLARI